MAGETVYRFLSAGAYWSINKYVARSIGIPETVILMEHVTFAERYQNEEGWYYRKRDVIADITGISVSSQQRKEKLLIELGLLYREQRGQDRKNWYKLDENNLGLFILDPLKYVKDKMPTFTPDDFDNGGNENNEENSQPVKLTSSSGQTECTINKKEVNHNNESSFSSKKNITPIGSASLRPTSQRRVFSSDARENNAASQQKEQEDSCSKQDVPLRKTIQRRNFGSKNKLSPPAPNVRQLAKEHADNLKPKVDYSKSHRKLHKETVDIINYWNSKEGLRNHQMVEVDGKYVWAAQSKVVKQINDHVFKLLRGELYKDCTDIVHVAVKTMKFKVEQVYTAIDRLAKSLTTEYGGTKKSASLGCFFYNATTEVYKTKDGNPNYKYKYGFLFYINGDVKKPQQNERKSEHESIVKKVIDKLQSDGIRIDANSRNKISRAVDKAIDILYRNRRRWKVEENKIMQMFPYMFYSCYRDTCNNGDLDSLWSMASYKFEKHLSDKSYLG